MKSLFASLLLVVCVFGQSAPLWQQGIIQSFRPRHTAALNWHTVEVEVEILGSDNISYSFKTAPKLHKVDLVPGVGIFTAAKRQSRLPLTVAVGSTVKFLVSGNRGSIIGADGMECSLILKRAHQM